MEDRTKIIKKEIGLNAERILGKGSFATVYFCRHCSTEESFAVKVFRRKDFTRNRLQYFRKQAEILQSIDHINVVKFHSFCETENSLYLIMQYIPGGTLKELMEKTWQRKKSFTDHQVSTIIHALLEGIKYLHKFNIIHRDLKPVDNILLMDSQNLSSIKIADFGLSAQLDHNHSKNVKAQCGTLLFMAPEILYKPSYTKSVDLWAVSVIMYMLYKRGQHPIFRSGMKNQTYKDKLNKSEFPELSHPLAQNFIKRISRLDYNERYSVNEALQHPWITRNSEDQIPLSVNQSIQSFDVSHQISKLVKAVYFVGKVNPNKFTQIPNEYRKKVDEFTKRHEQYRARSLSFKKVTKKTQGVFLKMHSILNPRQISFVNKFEKESIQQQVPSPIIRRHQRLYLRLFEKNKKQQQLTASTSNFILDLSTPILCTAKQEKCEVQKQILQRIEKKDTQDLEKNRNLNLRMRQYHQNQSNTQPEEKARSAGNKKKVFLKNQGKANSFQSNANHIQYKVMNNLAESLRGKIGEKSVQFATPSPRRSKNTPKNTLQRESLSMKIGFPSPKKPQTPISSKSYMNKPRNRYFLNTSKNIYL